MKICAKFEHNGETYVTDQPVPVCFTMSHYTSQMLKANALKGTVCDDFMEIPFIEEPEVKAMGGPKYYVKGFLTWEGQKYYMDTEVNGLEVQPAEAVVPNNEEEVEETPTEGEMTHEPEPEPEPVTEPEKEPEPEEAPELVPNPKKVTDVTATPKYVFGRRGRANVRLNAKLSHSMGITPPKKVVESTPPPVQHVDLDKLKEDMDRQAEEDNSDSEEVELEPEVSVEEEKVENIDFNPEVEVISEGRKFETPREQSERYENASSPDFVEPTTLEEVRAREDAEEEELEEVSSEPIGLPEWVEEVPKRYLRSIKAYTNEKVDEQALRTDGMKYCEQNKWEMHDDLAFIDQVKGSVRYIYNSTYDEYVALTPAQRRDLKHKK